MTNLKRSINRQGRKGLLIRVHRGQCSYRVRWWWGFWGGMERLVRTLKGEKAQIEFTSLRNGRLCLTSRVVRETSADCIMPKVGGAC